MNLIVIMKVSWSCSPIPIGKGKIKTDHGLLSIPAPATSILLKNIPVIEDGIEGERTTPTGCSNNIYSKTLSKYCIFE